MQRIANAILELESFRAELPLLTASDMMAYGLATTALATLHQIEALASVSPRLRDMKSPGDKIDEIINEVNREAG